MNKMELSWMSDFVQHAAEPSAVWGYGHIAFNLVFVCAVLWGFCWLFVNKLLVKGLCFTNCMFLEDRENFSAKEMDPCPMTAAELLEEELDDQSDTLKDDNSDFT